MIHECEQCGQLMLEGEAVDGKYFCNEECKTEYNNSRK